MWDLWSKVYFDESSVPMKFWVNLFWGVFWRYGTNVYKCKYVWWTVLEWNVFENGACSIIFDLPPQSASGRPFVCMCMRGGGGGEISVRVSSVTGT